MVFSTWAVTFTLMHFTNVSRYISPCKTSHSSSLMYRMTSGMLLHKFINRAHQLMRSTATFDKCRSASASEVFFFFFWECGLSATKKGNQGNQILINSQRIACQDRRTDAVWWTSLTKAVCCLLSARGANTCPPSQSPPSQRRRPWSQEDRCQAAHPEIRSHQA